MGSPSRTRSSRVGRLLNERARRVRVGFGMIPAQSVRRAGPDVPVLVFKNLMHGGVGQPVFPAVLDPDFLEETMDAGVIGHPHAAVAGALEGVDVVEAGVHGRPVAPVEFPKLVLRGAPNPPVGQFREVKDHVGHGAVRNRERPPFFLVIPGHALVAAQPEIAVARGEQGGANADRVRVGRRVGQRLVLDAVEPVEITRGPFPGGRFGIPALDSETAVPQQAQRLHVPDVVPEVEAGAERA